MTTQSERSKPTHFVRKSSGYGKEASYETIGVAWIDDNSIYVKLHGTQIVDRGFYIHPNTSANPESGQ